MGDRITPDIMLWFFLALFLASIVLLGWLLWPFMSVLILGAVVTGIFRPVYRYCGTRMQMRPAMASLSTCLLVFLVLFVPIVLFVGILTQEAYGLYQFGRSAVLSDQIRTLFESSTVLEKINRLTTHVNIELTGDQLHGAVSEAGKVVGLFLYEQARSIASNTLNFFVYFFFMLLVIYYLFIDGDRLISFIIDLSPLPKEQEEKLIGKFRDMAGAILVGNGLGGLIQGTLGGIVFYLFGINSAFLWGVIMGLLAFLPIIGIGVIFVPASAYLLLSGRIGAGIFFIVFYLVLSGGTEYLFKPKLVGKRVQMHTLLVFLAIIGGLQLFGILGIIYGPLIVTAFLTLSDIYHVSYQRLVESEKE